MKLHRAILSSITALALTAAAACGEPRGASDPGRVASSTAQAAGDEMERARACTADDECEHLGDFCKGGCAVTVNRKHRDAVRARLSTPRRECAIDCPAVDPPVCRKGLCVSPSR